MDFTTVSHTRTLFPLISFRVVHIMGGT